MGGWWPALASVACTVLILGLLYHGVIRPWHLRWGTIGDEATRRLAGDDVVPDAVGPVTHAIGIDAPAHEIWPWLVQMGQGRGGFYSYTWLENLFGCQMTNATEIVPEWQQLAIGDRISLHPKYRTIQVVVLEKERALVLAGRADDPSPEDLAQNRTQPHGLLAWTWAFVLDEREGSAPRLVARVRSQWRFDLRVALGNYLFGEAAHFVMERKMLYGIKRRVEQARQAR